MPKKTLSLSTQDGREAVFLQIIGLLLEHNDAGKRHIAEEAGVHWGTLYNWTHGKTLCPRIDTLSRVARALGYDIMLNRTRRVPKLRRVK